jgi:hypothetical protein
MRRISLVVYVTFSIASFAVMSAQSTIPDGPPAAGPACAGDVPDPEYLKSVYRGYGTLPTGRIGIVDDWQKSYVVITYNAVTHKTYWSDYPHGKTGAQSQAILSGQSAFTPILYSRERILVRVCGLHFGGSVTTTPTSLSLVDNGFDIRNAAVSPQPQGAIGPPVNPGAPPPAALPGYSDLAPQAIAYYREYAFLQSQLNLMSISASHDGGLSIADELRNLDAALAVQTNSPDSKTGVTQFNQLLAKVQQAVIDVGGLQTNLTNIETNIGKTLVADYAALAASIQNEQSQDAIDLAAVNTSTVELQKAVTAADIAKAKADIATAPSIVAKAKARQVARQQDLTQLGAAGFTVESIAANATPKSLLDSLSATRVGNPPLYATLGHIFQQINALHDNSDVSYISVITPLVGNGVESIDISVQDSYQPLTLASLSIYGTPPTVTQSNTSSSPNPSGMVQAQMSKPGKGGGSSGAAASPTTTTAPGAPSPATTAGSNTQTAGNAAPSNSQTTGPNGALPDSSIRIEVHRIANFNVLAGFAIAHIPVRAYSPITVSTAVTGGPAVGTYIVTTQNDSWQTYGIAGIAWYVGGRDMYPMSTNPRDQTGVVGTTRYAWLKHPSIVGASSITSLGTGFFGPALEPKPGISIMALGVWGATTKLAPGLTACTNLATCPSSAATPYPFTTAPTVSSHTWGLSFGVTLDPSVWSLFKPSGP